MREHVHELVDLLLALAGRPVVHRVADAGIDVGAQHERSRLSERGLRRRDLEEHVDAVPIVLDHSRNALDLPGDSMQAGDHLLLQLGVHHGGILACPRGA
jgi:hypothetical protein